jgi:hypothetical protein
MPGIGEQGDGVGQQPVKCLDRDEADVEYGADEKGAAKIRRSMGVPMLVLMLVSMVVGGTGQV